VSCKKRIILAVLVSHTLATTAIAHDHAVSPHATKAPNRVGRSGPKPNRVSHPLASTALDRVTFAIDGAESSHGADIAMWRPNPSGPQGPMQVSEAAAVDAGGGDRFDLTQNRAIGRAYLAQLYRRYKNWPDAIAAYNWGLSHVDGWVKAGRPSEKLVISVAAYTSRVLRDSGLCDGTKAKRRPRQGVLADRLDDRDGVTAPPTPSACPYPDTPGRTSRGKDRYLYGSAANHPEPGSELSRFEQEVQSARSSWECATTSGGSLRCRE
jgi:Transglycosylase SLT domain